MDTQKSALPLFLSATGKPFTDIDAARHKAKVMALETGDSFDVMDHSDGGYAVACLNNVNAGIHDVCEDLPYSGESPFDKVKGCPSAEPIKPVSPVNTKGSICASPSTLPASGKRKVKLFPSWFSFWKEFLASLVAVFVMLAPIATFQMIVGVERAAEFSNQVSLASNIRMVAFATILALVSRAFLIRIANRYIITDYEVASEIGIIQRKKDKVRLIDIRTVDVNQSILDRILGIGTLGFSSAGTDGVDVEFKNILDPSKFESLVTTLQRSIGNQNVSRE